MLKALLRLRRAAGVSIPRDRTRPLTRRRDAPPGPSGPARKGGGGLRHGYALGRYEEITGWNAPAAGGPARHSLTGARRRIDTAARRTIAGTRELDAEPWREALQRGRRGSPRPRGPPRCWQSRRAETGLAAAVGRRHAAAPAWDGKRKGVSGHSRSTCCGSARLAQRGDGSPITTSATPRPPRARDASPGRGRSCFGFGSSRRLARLVRRPEAFSLS